jgi:hypothetical protein
MLLPRKFFFNLSLFTRGKMRELTRSSYGKRGQLPGFLSVKVWPHGLWTAVPMMERERHPTIRLM